MDDLPDCVPDTWAREQAAQCVCEALRAFMVLSNTTPELGAKAWLTVCQALAEWELSR